jgi:ribonuclease G
VSKLVVVKVNLSEIKTAIIDNGKIVNLFIDRNSTNKILNNIYIGKIKNVVYPLNIAFVDIGFNKPAYLNINKKTIIKTGQSIMVQVCKEPRENKGAKLTTDIVIPGKFLVYAPFGNISGISKNIKNKLIKNNLKKTISSLKNNLFLKGSIIIRTEAEKTSELEIKKEAKYILKLWKSIKLKFKNAKQISLIYKDLSVTLQVIRDYLTEDITFIYVDSYKEFNIIFNFLSFFYPKYIKKLTFYDNKIPSLEIIKHKVVDEIKNYFLSNKIRLKSGGYLIIQENEFICTIDVNSGNFIKEKTKENIAILINTEAAEEIMRLLKLRNIGGIIIVDFIDMKEIENKIILIKKLRKLANIDKAKVKICSITKLGLVEITRERKTKSILLSIGNKCKKCNGLGFVLSNESIFINVCNEIEEKLKISNYNYNKIIISFSANELIEYFNMKKNEIEKLFKIKVNINKKILNKSLKNNYEILLK